MSRLGFKGAHEVSDIVWIVNHEQHMDVGGFDQEMANVHWVEGLSTRKAAFYDRFAERIAEQQQPFFDGKGAKEDTVVGVVLHVLRHEHIFEFGGEKLLGFSPNRRKCSPATGFQAGASAPTVAK